MKRYVFCLHLNTLFELTQHLWLPGESRVNSLDACLPRVLKGQCVNSNISIFNQMWAGSYRNQSSGGNAACEDGNAAQRDAQRFLIIYHWISSSSKSLSLNIKTIHPLIHGAACILVKSGISSWSDQKFSHFDSDMALFFISVRIKQLSRKKLISSHYL